MIAMIGGLIMLAVVGWLFTTILGGLGSLVVGIVGLAAAAIPYLLGLIVFCVVLNVCWSVKVLRYILIGVLLFSLCTGVKWDVLLDNGQNASNPVTAEVEKNSEESNPEGAGVANSGETKTEAAVNPEAVKQEAVKQEAGKVETAAEPVKPNTVPDWEAFGGEMVRKAYADNCLDAGDYKYAIENTLDGKATTCWADGVKGSGEGVELIYFFHKPAKVVGLEIWSGYQKTDRLFKANNAPRTIKIFRSQDLLGTFVLEHKQDKQRIYFNEKQEHIDHIIIRIADVYKGMEYDDTCISEVKFLVAE